MIFPAWVNRLLTYIRPYLASVIERDRKKAPRVTQRRDRVLTYHKSILNVSSD